ncbi:DNA replication/repair protein RecF [Streptococcus sp. 263_SSPC]|uniref:DNA replication/repair protein RecF n=1 Tax=Streptococcus sp. 263_SSPC TaxID=1579343 RepID=UPI00065F86D1|nr:DNA replication/repair protein RecF [Streptococcus sp. 263_SSPC]
MKLTNLQLQNFRNYESVQLEFTDGVHVFIGENAQGKTNLMESIYALAMTKSHRTTNDKELIGWNKEFATIKGTVEKTTTKTNLELQFSKKGKIAKVNYLEQKRLSSYLGNLNVILFAPENLTLVKGSPQNRRKFVDMELGQMSSLYLYDLVEYNRVLKQRNTYFKQLAIKKKQPDEYLDVLSEMLSELASKIVFHRLDFMKQLEALAIPIHDQLSLGREKFSVSYQATIPLEDGLTPEQMKEIYMNQFKKNQTREADQATTLIGPHRDDLIFYLNEVPVQTYGSQGQQRSTVLSLKLAEIELMKLSTGEYPLLLLDDVLSELDDDRQTHLIKAIENKVQTFITTTSLDGIKQQFINEPVVIPIEKGTILKTESEN